MSILKDTIRRTIIALASKTAGNNLLGAVGLYGGARITASADTVAYSTGDISVQLDSGGAPCTYRVTFPNANANIASIDWIDVGGFTPRAPSGVETLTALVTGYNYDTTLNQWYITVQIVTLGTGAAVSAVTAAGFVIGVRAAVTLNPGAPYSL
jgi:hypothetical protein